MQKKRPPIGILCVAFFCAICATSHAEINLGPWQIRHPHPSSYCRDLAFDGKKYVLVDGYGNIFTSFVGRNWTVQQTPGLRALDSVAFGRTNFVAVGLNGVILSSPDGTNWVSVASGVTNDLARVSFVDERFVVVGGAILSSSDGLAFTVEQATVPKYLRNIGTGPGTILAVGENTILVSTNQGEWKQALVTTTNLFYGATYFAGAYNNGWYSTTNAMVWTNRMGTTQFTNISTVVANSNVLGRVKNGEFQWSPNGSSWFSAGTAVERRPLFTIRALDNRFHLVGGDAIYFGDAATQFTPMHSRLTDQGNPIWFKKVVAATNGYAATVLYGSTFYSPDGQSWRPREFSDPLRDTTNDFAFAKPPLARARSGFLEQSDDGVEWHSIRRPEIETLQAAALGSVVVASGRSNLWATADGTNWTKLMTKMGPPTTTAPEGGTSEIPPRDPWILSLTAAHGMLAATTSWGEILFSTNGFNWERNQTTFQWIEDLTFTPHGIMVASFGLLAEARFDGGVDALAPSRITVDGNQFRFEGPLRHHDIEFSTDLNSGDWTVFRSAATNTVWNVSTIAAPDAVFFRTRRSE